MLSGHQTLIGLVFKYHGCLLLCYVLVACVTTVTHASYPYLFPVVPLLFNIPGAHKCCEAAPRSVQHSMITWNRDVLTIAARLCPYLDHSYITATTEAT